MRSAWPFDDPSVAQVFGTYREEVREPLLRLRQLVLETAGRTEAVVRLVEALRWGQPAYLPATPRTGTTIRIDALKSSSFDYAMFFHCQTTLVAEFRIIYADVLAFEGNRAIIFRRGDALPEEALTHCIARALTYHVRRQQW